MPLNVQEQMHAIRGIGMNLELLQLDDAIKILPTNDKEAAETRDYFLLTMIQNANKNIPSTFDKLREAVTAVQDPQFTNAFLNQLIVYNKLLKSIEKALPNEVMQTLESIRLVTERITVYGTAKTDSTSTKPALANNMLHKLKQLELDITKGAAIDPKEINERFEEIISSTGSPTLDGTAVTTNMWKKLSPKQNIPNEMSLPALLNKQQAFYNAVKDLPSIKSCPESVQPMIDRLNSTIPIMYDDQMSGADKAMNNFIDTLPSNLNKKDGENINNYLQDVKTKMCEAQPGKRDLIESKFAHYSQTLDQKISPTTQANAAPTHGKG